MSQESYERERQGFIESKKMRIRDKLEKIKQEGEIEFDIETDGIPADKITEDLLVEINGLLGAIHKDGNFFNEHRLRASVRRALRREKITLDEKGLSEYSASGDNYIEFSGNDKYGITIGLCMGEYQSVENANELKDRVFILLFSRHAMDKEWLQKITAPLIDAGLPLQPYIQEILTQE